MPGTLCKLLLCSYKTAAVVKTVVKVRKRLDREARDRVIACLETAIEGIEAELPLKTKPRLDEDG